MAYVPLFIRKYDQRFHPAIWIVDRMNWLHRLRICNSYSHSTQNTEEEKDNCLSHAIGRTVKLMSMSEFHFSFHSKFKQFIWSNFLLFFSSLQRLHSGDISVGQWYQRTRTWQHNFTSEKSNATQKQRKVNDKDGFRQYFNCSLPLMIFVHGKWRR